MVDQEKSELVFTTAQKVMSTETPTIVWMTAELADHLLHMFSAAKAKMHMELMRQGMDPKEAEQSVGVQIPLLCFQLGMQVGTELEAGRAFREMFGGDDDVQGG